MAPASISYDEFFGKAKKEQANLIWKFLFVERVPCSEAAIGVWYNAETLGSRRLLAAPGSSMASGHGLRVKSLKSILRTFSGLPG